MSPKKETINLGDDILDELTPTPGATPKPFVAHQRPAPLGVTDIPEPPPVELDVTGDLSDVDLADLKVCEAGVENLRVAFVIAGKALATIRNRRLYRGTHETFDAYLAERWGIKRAHADRLAREWELGAHVDELSGGATNEGQVRELAPIDEEHSRAAVDVVYTTVAEHVGGPRKVTAELLRGARSVLPARWRKDEAVRAIRKFLRDGPPPAPAPEVGKVVETIHRSVLRAAKNVQPEQRAQVAAELRRLADEIAGNPS